jgi:hypothetical protein
VRKYCNRGVSKESMINLKQHCIFANACESELMHNNEHTRAQMHTKVHKNMWKWQEITKQKIGATRLEITKFQIIFKRV